MTYARFRSRGYWSKTHIAPAGIRTLCGRKLIDVPAEVELSHLCQGAMCIRCLELAPERKNYR